MAKKKRQETAQIEPRDLWAGDAGSYPSCEEALVLRLARAIHESESTDRVISWPAQERAMDYFNKYGLEAALDEATRLEAVRLV